MFWAYNTEQNTYSQGIYTQATTEDTTPPPEEPQVPSDINIIADGQFKLDLSWTKAEDITRIEYRTTPGEWTKGTGILLYNGPGETTSLQDLSAGQTIYFMFWAYNTEQNTYSQGIYTQATTNQNHPATYNNEKPTTGQTNHPTTLTWQIDINDPDNDYIRWWIICNNGQRTNGISTNPQTIQLPLTNLAYDTTYNVRVYLNDGFIWTYKEFHFKTTQD